jgi:hypothetical protein
MSDNATLIVIKTNEVVAVVISLLRTNPDLHLIMTMVSGDLEEVLRQELTLLVEVIASPLCVKFHHNKSKFREQLDIRNRQGYAATLYRAC